MENSKSLPDELALEISRMIDELVQQGSQKLVLSLEAEKRLIRIAIAWGATTFRVVEDYNPDDYAPWDACIFDKNEVLSLSNLPPSLDNMTLLESAIRLKILLPFGNLHPAVHRYLETKAEHVILDMEGNNPNGEDSV